MSWISLALAILGGAITAIAAVNCPGGFRNVFFNAYINEKPGWPTIFDTVQAQGGAQNFISFTVDPIPGANAAVNAGQIKMIIDPNHTQQGIDLLNTNPLEWLDVYNEPDFSYAVQTTTKFTSPGPAYTGSSWLPQFFDNCSCEDRFSVMNAHIYDPDPQRAIDLVKRVRYQFSDKHLWLTEISPTTAGTPGCLLDENGMKDWMNKVLGFAATSGYVDKVFWNSGEYGEVYIDNPTASTVCNPSLTDKAGNGTPLLANLGDLCN